MELAHQSFAFREIQMNPLVRGEQSEGIITGVSFMEMGLGPRMEKFSCSDHDYYLDT